MLLLSNLVWANYPFETFAELTKKAERGDAMSQTMLGTAYHFGQEKEFVAKDYRKALYWYQKAAMQNNAIACYQLGIMYKFGRGVEQDKTKAFHWFLTSAELGESSAQSEVAFAYYGGEGANRDYRKAFYWFKRLADERALYQNIVGIMYKEGLGVEQDQTLAFHYFNQTFQLKPNDAKLQEELALRYYFGDGVAKNEQQGFKLFLKAAKQGRAESQY